MGLFKKKHPTSTYAPVETNLLVKADRINTRIEKLKGIVLNQYKKQIPAKDFEDVIKAIEIIVSQELNTKKKERI